MNRILLPVPHLQQQERGECLAACAAMLLAYLGRPVRYKHLLKVLQVSSQIGAPASRIRRLEQPGLKVVYQHGTLPDLQEQLTNNRPCIAFVKTGELPYWDEDCDHAAVVAGLDDEFVYLNDPAFPDAPVQVPRGDFDLAWLGRDEFFAALVV